MFADCFKLHEGLVIRAKGDKVSGPDALKLVAKPVLYKDSDGYQIKPHPDTRNKVVTMQLYCPKDESQADLGTTLYQASLKRHPLIPDVPTLPELALTDEGRQVLRATASTGDIGRSIVTTPGVPPERLAALRAAFAAMLKDPEFIAECDHRKLPIEGAGGEEVDAMVRETLALPRPVLDEIGKMMK